MTTEAPATHVPHEDHSTGAAWRTGFPAHIRPWTHIEQARHRATLLDGLAGYAVGQPMQATPPQQNRPTGDQS